MLSVAVDGLIKPHAPGSLYEPATTTLLPSNWNAVPLSFGLLMGKFAPVLKCLDEFVLTFHIAPWGGHGVFPNIYKDMRHPHKYEGGLRVIFSFTVSSSYRTSIHDMNALLTLLILVLT